MLENCGRDEGRREDAFGSSLLERYLRLDDHGRAQVLAGMDARQQLMLMRDWRWTARPAQLAPDQRPGGEPVDWGIWLILAGRGFGKTRAGAEWVQSMALDRPGSRIALVGPTAHDVATVMVRGESGLLGVATAGMEPRFTPSRRRIEWRNGSHALVFSAAEPDSLRGGQFHFAWCDELASWARPAEAWHNLRMALRLGERPRVVVTTTPRPIALLRALVEDPAVAVTRGGTADNRANLPAAFVRDMEAAYGRSRLGRQELDGELIEAHEGALWTPGLLDACREERTPALLRVVVGVDPPAGPGGCGIVVAGVDDAGIGHVLADCSVDDSRPADWAAAVAAAALRHGADRVVAEINNGGEMVEAVLRAADVRLALKTVRASRGKSARAEPVAALYEAGRVRHAGLFARLEDELCGLMAGGGYRGPGGSPDRADALVWALTELLLSEPMAPPRLRAVI